jgi:signal recognition particle receptor subunit beta
MVVISYAGKEANAKLVYYGPGLGGKTTNLEFIYDSVPSSSRGKMVSMKTQTDRTLFFDFLPLDLGELGGFKTRFLLYTVPGQVFYNATRKLVLRGADAVAFIADSQVGKMDENKESLANLEDNLADYDLSLDSIPWVIQYNKRDLPDIYSVEELNKELNVRNVPYFEAISTEGVGVFETFRGLSKLLLEKLSEEIGQRLIISKHIGPEPTQPRETAAEEATPAPATELAEVAEVAEPAKWVEAVEVPEESESTGTVEEPEPVEIPQAAEAPEPVQPEEAFTLTAASQEEWEPEPKPLETSDTFELAAPAQTASQNVIPDITPDAEMELSEAVLEQPDAAPEADTTHAVRDEIPSPEAAGHADRVPEAPGVDFMRERESIPNFFAKTPPASRLDLERDTSRFAEKRETTPQVMPQQTIRPLEAWKRIEARLRQEKIAHPEQVQAARPVERATQDEAEEELSFLSIVRRNNVGVFERGIPNQEPEPREKLTPVAEARSEKGAIEGCIEIPVPLANGEKMEEMTLSIKLRLKPVAKGGRVTEHEFKLNGISR